jgi:ComF family protein
VPYICKDCAPLKDILSPNFCEKCLKPRDISPHSPFCPYCNGEKFPFELFVSPFINQGAIKKSILDFKFANKCDSSLTYAHYINIRIKGLKNFSPQVIVPAPSSKERMEERGYNPPSLIAQCLSDLLNLPVDEVVTKIKHTPPQSTLTIKERETNLKDAFEARENSYKSVLLVDDIYTTGSTVREICKELKKSGVRTIYVTTVAKTLPKDFNND